MTAVPPAEFSPQGPDLLAKVVLAHRGLFPDRRGKMIPTQWEARMLNQSPEGVEFPAGERNWLAISRKRACERTNPEGVELEYPLCHLVFINDFTKIHGMKVWRAFKIHFVRPVPFGESNRTSRWVRSILADRPNRHAAIQANFGAPPFGGLGGFTDNYSRIPGILKRDCL
ncbi:MAG TPA: hypothetical protein VHW09_08550 [Bryobacteraceae bacterium]|nr:hypothetical protein [Bryobacteraceae bacterium]